MACYFFNSDTTSEKDFEEFYNDEEILDIENFNEIGIIKNNLEFDKSGLENFEMLIAQLKRERKWDKKILIDSFQKIIPNFKHMETGKYLNQRM